MGVYKEIEINYFEALENAGEDELMIRRFINMFLIKPEQYVTARALLVRHSNKYSLSK
jgi:hypothetical protein